LISPCRNHTGNAPAMLRYLFKYAGIITVKFTLILIPLSIVAIILTVQADPQSSAFSNQGNSTIKSFSKAKKILHKQIYPDHRTTFYCGCPYNAEKQILPCDHYTPKKPGKRSKRVEWEHIVPAHAFGQSFKEWRDGHSDCVNSKGKSFKGRNCARKKAIKFRYMESDLYNLVPAVGEINGRRSNYSFGMIPGEPREFGACDIEIVDRKAEPPEKIRGNIARTYMYMDSVYPGHGIISKKNRKLFEAWNKMDPVDEWECERARRIERIQGNENWVVKGACASNN